MGSNPTADILAVSGPRTTFVALSARSCQDCWPVCACACQCVLRAQFMKALCALFTEAPPPPQSKLAAAAAVAAVAGEKLGHRRGGVVREWHRGCTEPELSVSTGWQPHTAIHEQAWPLSPTWHKPRSVSPPHRHNAHPSTPHRQKMPRPGIEPGTFRSSV